MNVQSRIGSDTTLARALWAPRSIALVGASEGDQKHNALPLSFLKRHGYAGKIYPVNPRRSEVQGERAYARITDIPAPVDHALIMVPTAAVADTVAACCAHGVRCATILTDGFAERGAAGIERQERLLALAREGGLRLLGPNSIGLINPPDRVALSANEVLSLPDLPVGRTGLVSQSGSLIGTLLSRGSARGIGFSKLISVGNESDLDSAEIAGLLVDDPQTDVVLLFLETVRRPDALAATVARAHRVGKPVLAFRLGRTAVVEQIAASHTGALAGNGAALDAFLRDIGVICLEQFESMLEAPALVAGRVPSKGRRVAVVSTTGGGAALVVDKLGSDDVTVVPPSPEVVESLRRDGIEIPQTPLIDLTLAGANARTYGRVLEALLESDHCDLVISVVGSSSQFRPDRAVAPIQAVAGRFEKPLAAFLTPEAGASLSMLRESGIAGFRTPEACADAVRAYLTWRRPRHEATAVLDPVERERLALALKGSPQEGPDLLAALGIPRPQELFLRAPFDEIPEDLVYPVVAKVASASIDHKTEAGGVVLNIGSAEDLRAACCLIVSNVSAFAPAAVIEGIQVQSQEAGLAEAIVGFRLDPVVGPTVTLGVGGVLTEIYRDFSVRPAPVTAETALEMLSEVRGLRVIDGYRNLPRGDVQALAAAVQAMSRLALLDQPLVLEAEINPLLVKPEGQGVVALDSLLRVEAHS